MNQIWAFSHRAVSEMTLKVVLLLTTLNSFTCLVVLSNKKHSINLSNSDNQIIVTYLFANIRNWILVYSRHAHLLYIESGTDFLCPFLCACTRVCEKMTSFHIICSRVRVILTDIILNTIEE
ncbi:hypothetical protein Droror1_Dr00014693 [Drosera rotundifolia]